MKSFFYIILCAITLVNCKAQLTNTSKPILTNKGLNPYLFNAPSQTFDMPEKLKEISGLSLSPDGKHLCAVNDEQGIIFYINKEKGEVEKEVKFHKNGDYEGIESVGDHFYIVKSSGTVYKVSDLDADTISMKKAKYLFKKENDTEGLAYDKKNHQLLFACKGRACLHDGCRVDGCRDKKSIYCLDLKKNRVAKKPIFEISIKDVQAHLKNTKTPEELVEKYKAFINPKENDFHFHPSGLAIHPTSGDIYILASKGKMMIVLHPDGSIKHMEKLDKKIHSQPEGITFDEDGTMYICNEGKKKKTGKIYVYNIK